MNMHVLPPTAAAAHARHLALHASIAARAAALEEKKRQASPILPAAIAELSVPAPALPVAISPGYFPPPHFPDTFVGGDPEPLVFPETPRIRDVQLAVATAYRMTLAEMLSKRRFGPLVNARQVAMHLCCRMTFKSLPEIGRYFGGMDHTTVLHADRQIIIKSRVNPELSERIELLREDILGRVAARSVLKPILGEPQ